MKDELMTLLPGLRRFAWSLTHSVHDADDLLQATVERLLNRGVPEGVEVARWAFTVCRNLWIDEYRARRTRQNATGDTALMGAGDLDGERQVHAEMELEEVSRAMQQLPVDQQLVLTMVTVQGLSYRRVAEALDIPVGTVMSRLARARAKLVELMNTTKSGAEQ